jgi:hypothetical protein
MVYEDHCQVWYDTVRKARALQKTWGILPKVQYKTGQSLSDYTVIQFYENNE